MLQTELMIAYLAVVLTHSPRLVTSSTVFDLLRAAEITTMFKVCCTLVICGCNLAVPGVHNLRQRAPLPAMAMASATTY